MAASKGTLMSSFYWPPTGGGGGGSGTVTSITAGTGLTGGTITSSGTIALAIPVTVPDGGTGDTSLTLDGVLYGNGTSPVGVTAAGITGQVLTATTGSAPTWASPASPTSGNLTDTGTDGIVVTGGTGAVLGSGTSLAQHVADTTHNGYLSSTDWNTFNGKGSGTVTSVSSSGATGLTLTTTNATTTPAIALGGTLTIAGGGTGQTSASAAFNALSPMTTTGDLEYEASANTAARLPIGSTGNVLTVAGGVPAWAAPATSGTVTSIVAGTGLTGGTITSSGTIALDLTHVNAWSGQQYFAQQALTSGSSIAWNLNTQQSATLTLATNATLSNPTNQNGGGTYTLIITQDGTGSRTLAFGTAYFWPAGIAPILSTAAGAIDILTFISDGTNMYGVAQRNFLV